jgi:ubiquinone/menaquinone biosynthesis C-methylase UbiE
MENGLIEAVQKASGESESYYSNGLELIDTSSLDLQHEWIKKTLGYILHPQIKVGSHARIADVATGTGVFVRDLAQRLPETCQFDGLDISDEQFPKETPKNVSFRVMDAKSSPPAELKGQYDVVALRFVAAAMHGSEDWERVARNAFELLKPGGYLQWVELDLIQATKFLRGDPTIPISGMLSTYVRLQSRDSLP